MQFPMSLPLSYSTVIVLLLVLTSASPLKVPDSDACFEKRQRCCYKYSFCGYITRETESSSTCKIKKCGKECEGYCKGRPSCLEKCRSKTCVEFDGTCLEEKNLRYPKFCPKLECDAERKVFEAGKKEPGVYVDASQVEVKTKRTDKILR